MLDLLKRCVEFLKYLDVTYGTWNGLPVRTWLWLLPLPEILLVATGVILTSILLWRHYDTAD